MSTLRKSGGRAKRIHHHHANKQAGWKDTGSKVGYNRGQLKDETYDQTLAIHDPLWRYIIQRYPKEAQCPIVVVGYNSIPIAIELSQWTYPVTYMTSSYEGVKKAERDNEIHAGNFKQMYYCDFLETFPRCRVVTFINTLGLLSTPKLYSFLDMALRRSQEVVASEKDTKNWFDILKSRYDVKITKYEDESWNLIRIKQLQH